MTVLCVNKPSGHSTKKQLARRRLFEGLQKYMDNKNKEMIQKLLADCLQFLIIIFLITYLFMFLQILISWPNTSSSKQLFLR